MKQAAVLCALFTLVCLSVNLPLWAQKNQPVDPSASIQELIEILKGKDDERAMWAAQFLGEHGANAEKAVPALVKVVKQGRNTKVRVIASIALLKIDPVMRDLVPILLQALEKGQSVEGGDSSAQPQGASAGEILALQDDALRKWYSLLRAEVSPEIVPFMVKALKENDKDIRIMAVLLLGGISVKVPEVIPYVIQALKDEDPDVRSGAVGALSRMGPSVKEVIPALIGALEDEDENVRLAAMKALAKRGPSANEAVPVLTKFLQKEKESRLRVGVAMALLEIEPSPRQVVPVLVAVLKDKKANGDVLSAAADTLGKLGPAAQEAVPALQEALRNPDVRSTAAEALSKVGSAALPALIQSLNDEDRSVRYLAAETLGRLGPAAEEALPALIQALKDPDSGVRSSAATALKRISGKKAR